jgi:hypothetical protein
MLLVSTGSRVSDEVVQVYVKQPRTTIKAPSVRLAAFERIYSVAAGSTRTVKLHVWPGMSSLPPILPRMSYHVMVTINHDYATEYHSVVLDSTDVYKAQQIVETGAFNIYVGGMIPSITV